LPDVERPRNGKSRSDGAEPPEGVGLPPAETEAEASARHIADLDDNGKVRIYPLPNLLTAANLACGFFAMTWIFRYEVGGDFEPIRIAIRFILAAFAFDFFDGLLARVVGHTSRFGMEFDSLADMVSFGMVPAFLVYRIVLQGFHKTSALIAAVYLVCGGIRLARFNVLNLLAHERTEKEFIGFPIPSAAGLVVSVTLFLMWLSGHERSLGAWRYALWALMLLLSWLMVSNVRYPAFKQVEWTPMRSASAFSVGIGLVLLLVLNLQVTLALVFLSYMFYGLVSHWIRRGQAPPARP
jgi:CDP-diacylglycerol---serine O-phosphatidyltransferase